MKKTNLSPDSAEAEIGRLHLALEGETLRCLKMQQQLDRAGAEFEEFVSMAAHNLRESLRDVAAFSQLMAETHGGRLDSEAGEFLERIREGAANMQSQLSAMVDYSAAGVGDPQDSRTDMEGVLRQTLLCADTLITERGAIMTHDPLPSVTGNFEILTKVLHHLVRNAIEYCGASPPRVHISASLVDLDWVFSVQDNGPGIDPALQGRLFRAFKRLHGRDYPGHGLGLAFCKKSIEGHGGRMWMESTPGVGSTFYFTLPPAE